MVYIVKQNFENKTILITGNKKLIEPYNLETTYTIETIYQEHDLSYVRRIYSKPLMINPKLNTILKQII